jgi:hypothetical protein
MSVRRTDSVKAVIAVVLCAAAAVALPRNLAGNHEAAQRPRVSADFEAAVAQLANEGLRLKEALEASLDGASRHLVAVFDRANPKTPNEAFEFRILESSGGSARTVFRRTEFFFSLPRAGELAKLNATDINGDGLREVIVQSSSGGNCWSCNPAEIYRVRNHKGELVAAGPIQRIVDLDGNGVAELLLTDARWEVYDELSHAASPSAVIVYAWRGGQYAYASPDFGAFYQSEVARLRASIAEARNAITTDDFSDELYVGQAISLAITYAHMGDPDRGLRELEVLMSSDARSAEQVKRRRAILDDFRNGESSKKLREMKQGDPLPLG